MSSKNGFEILETSPEYFWFLAVLAVLAVSISKAGFGGAMGSFSVPILIFVLPPKLALGVLLPLFLVTDVWVVYIWRSMLDKHILLTMCAFGVIGEIVGWLIFDYLNDQILTGLIGLIAIITAFNYGWRRLRPGKQSSEEITASVSRRIFQRGAIWCGLSGISSFVSLSGGIPAQVFLLPHALARQSFVGTLCVYFFVINIVKIPFYAEIGIFSEATLTVSLWLLLVIPLGVFIGKWLNTHISDQIFYDISHLGLLAMGAKLLLSIF